jgi:hypothetical protein
MEHRIKYASYTMKGIDHLINVQGTSLSTVVMGTEFKMSSGPFSVTFNTHSPAMHYLSLHPDMVNRRETLNDFFFRQTSIPFVNFQESRPVQTSIRSMKIVAGHESDVVSICVGIDFYY